MYIYLLPYEQGQELCYILDQNDKWQELGGVHMKYNISELDAVKRKVAQNGKSPTEELLTIWGHHNHTVLELFILLSNMKCYQAMVAIKKSVDPQYYYLIKDSNETVDAKEKKKNNILDSQIHQNNINDDTDKVINKYIINNFTTSNNESRVEKLNIPLLIPPKSPVLFGKSRMTIASDKSAVVERAGAIPCIPYEELQKSTNNWDEQTVLGRGGFGKVFKGNNHLFPKTIFSWMFWAVPEDEE